MISFVKDWDFRISWDEHLDFWNRSVHIFQPFSSADSTVAVVWEFTVISTHKIIWLMGSVPFLIRT